MTQPELPNGPEMTPPGAANPAAQVGVGGIRRLLGAFRRKGAAEVQPPDPAASHAIADPTSIYTDATAFTERIHQSSLLLRDNPQLRQYIRQTIVRRGNNPVADQAIYATVQNVVAAAEQGGMFDKEPLEIILDYVNFCYGVDYIKVRATSLDAPTDRSNAIMNLFSDAIVRSLSSEQVSDFLTSARSVSARMRELPRQHDKWALSKVNSLIHSLERKAYFELYVAELGGTIKAVSPEKVAKDTEDIAALFREMLSSRKAYGILLSYVESGIGGSLVFDELSELFEDVGKNIHARINGRGRVQAVVAHSRNRSFENLEKPAPYKERFSEEAVLTFSDISSLNAAALFMVGPDGELYHDHRLQFPVRDVFVAHGKYEHYRRLQGEILTNLFDLMTSEEVADTIGAKNGLRPARTIHDDLDNDPIDVLYDLIVPRLNALKIKTPRPKKQEPLGVIRVHNVAYHKRLLPPGWHPSPRALQLAQEANYPLPEGYTFVKAHERGNPARGRVTGHHLKKRK